jgi:hypothetical protein
MSLIARLFAAALLLSLNAFLACGTAATLNIPTEHPRLWYSGKAGTPGAARLTRARSFVGSNPVPINTWHPPTQSRDRALRSLLSGKASDGCTEAISWMKTFDFPSANEARWSGEQPFLVFDWCYAHMSAQDRDTIIGKWNATLARYNAEAWGGPGQPANNFFWGYLRNSLLWGIVSYHHNARAQEFIDNALDLRYRSLTNPPLANGSKFNNWYSSFGVGGVPMEGTQYGIYMLGYPVIAFTSAGDYGYDAWNAVPFWRDAIYYLHYATTPARTQKQDGASSYYEIFPFNDDETFINGQDTQNTDYSNFLGAMILRYPSTAFGRQAHTWLQTRGIPAEWWVRAELASVSVTGTTPTFPLDYYAAGARFLYGRSARDENATTFMLQLGGHDSTEVGGGVGHHHLDAGNFQLWRKGRWISRETTGYDILKDGIRSWNNGAVVDPKEAVAHNALLFEGRGQLTGRRGWPKVLRLQSTDSFAYSAVDLTDSYRTVASQTWEAKYDWPFAEKAVREFVYLRGLETLIVLDRARSGSASLGAVYNSEYPGPRLAGNQVRKTFVLHATGTGSNAGTNPFTLGSGKATATVGTQRLDLKTLLPATPAYRVVQEGGAVGQFRLEYDVSGSEQSYLLNVVSARDGTESEVTASLSDLGTSWQLTLSHPQKGSATVQLSKGETSGSGSVRINQGAQVALLQSVQAMQVTDNGPVWQGQTVSTGRITGGNLPPLLSTGSTGAAIAYSQAPAMSPPAAAGAPATATAASTPAKPSARTGVSGFWLFQYLRERWFGPAPVKYRKTLRLRPLSYRSQPPR